MTDLQNSVSRLHLLPTEGGAEGGERQRRFEASVSSAISTPTANGPRPHHASAAISPITSVAGTPLSAPTNNEKTASLLNLLRFNHASLGDSPSVGGQQLNHSVSLPLSSSDPALGSAPLSGLVAQLTRKASSPLYSSRPSSFTPDAHHQTTKPSVANPQNILLNLLNSNSIPSEPSVHRDGALTTAGQQNEQSETEAGRVNVSAPIRIFGDTTDTDRIPFTAPHTASVDTVFTYVNPFEQLSASPARNRSPKPDGKPVSGGDENPKMAILRSEFSLRHQNFALSDALISSLKCWITNAAYRASAECAVHRRCFYARSRLDRETGIVGG